MGDKSPKSKQRGEKQKAAAGAKTTAVARAKQDSQGQAKPTPKNNKK